MTEKKNKRLGIFVLKDTRGKIHESDKFFLDALFPYLSQLVIVTCNTIDNNSKEILLSFTSDIIQLNKANLPFAYLTGFNCLDSNKRNKYDEIIFFNNDLFGPLSSINDMFRQMDDEELDFWGLHWRYSHKAGEYERSQVRTKKNFVIADHIPWSLFAVRKKLFTDLIFQATLQHAASEKDNRTAQFILDVESTVKYVENGFCPGTVLETEPMRDYVYYPLLTAPLQALSKLRSPFMYKRLFYMDLSETLEYTFGQETQSAARYIDEQTDYDINLLWDSVLKIGNQHDIKNALGLTFALPDSYDMPHKTHEVHRVALCMHLYYETLFDSCLTYAKSMPEYADIYITTNTEEKKQILQEKVKSLTYNNIEIRVIGNRGRDVSALVIGCKDVVDTYDFICFAHDKKSVQYDPYCVAESFADQCFENTLGSRNYVNNIIQTLVSHPRLGILSPTPPFHSVFFSTMGREWVHNFEKTCELAERLGIDVPMTEEKPPIAPLGTMFWFRGDALKILCEENLTYEDFPPEPNNVDGTILHAYERLYPYAAQQSGYFAGHVMTDTYSRTQMNAHYHMLHQFGFVCFNRVQYDCNTYNKLINRVDIKLKRDMRLVLKRFGPIKMIWSVIRPIIKHDKRSNKND